MCRTDPIQSIPSTPIYLVDASKSLAHPPALSLAIPRGARGASGTPREKEEDEDDATRSGRRGRTAGQHLLLLPSASTDGTCARQRRGWRADGRAKGGAEREGRTAATPSGQRR
jgi:hypothetical protein